MIAVKRFWIITAVVALTLGALGVATVGASNSAHPGGALPQDKGEGWLGVGINDTPEGVAVAEVVPGSPADDAGLRTGDVILAVDGTEIDAAETLVETIRSYAPGDKVALTVESRGEERNVVVTLGERPEAVEFEADVRPMQGMMYFLGVEAHMTDEGLLIESLEDDSPLAEAGLQEGDLITAINGEAVDELFPRLLMEILQPKDTVTFTVQRDGEELEIDVNLGEIVGGALGGPAWVEVPSILPSHLGVRFTTLTPEIAEERGLDVSEGALIEEVFEDTPAAGAGLQEGDIVTAVDGDAVDEEHTLHDRLYAYEGGDVVTLTVLRDGEELELEITLGPRSFWRPGMMGQYGPHMGWRFGREGRNGPGMRFHFSMPKDFDMEQFEDMFPRFFENHPFYFGPDGEFEFYFGPSDVAPSAPDEEPAPDVESTAA